MFDLSERRNSRPGVMFNLVLVLLAISVRGSLVKNVTILGPQENPDVLGISRDGGLSVLLHDRVVWLYDDTSIVSESGEILEFISNSAAYASRSSHNVLIVEDFGFETTYSAARGFLQTGFVDRELSKNGGWIPFTAQEARFNRQSPGEERLAIWPGTNPTPLSSTKAILYAPIVLVRNATYKSPETYTYRGMTLIYIEASCSGPVASRAVTNLFSKDEVPYGGFGAIVGNPDKCSSGRAKSDYDLYLFGIDSAGLKVARVRVKHIELVNRYEYFHPELCSFSKSPGPSILSKDRSAHFGDNFSSGSVFYSPWFKTFLMIYFTDQADSTFYLRFLDLSKLACPTDEWTVGGRGGAGVTSKDVEAVVRYAWSDPQILFRSPPAKRGYNYAGIVHPEFFTRQYYQSFMYRSGGIDTPMAWYGQSVVEEENAGGDGKHLLLSWTAQDEDDLGNGRYQVMLATVEFDNNLGLNWVSADHTSGGARTFHVSIEAGVIATFVVAWLNV